MIGLLQNEASLSHLEAAEEEYASAGDSEPCKLAGEEQGEYLKALDCIESLTPNVILYNDCKARTSKQGDAELGIPCQCGPAVPAKPWKQTPSKWQFWCAADGTRLLEHAAKAKQGNQLNIWVENLVAA